MRAERTVRDFLRNDFRPWLVLAFALIFGVYYLALMVNARAYTKKAESAKRQAAITQCLKSRPLIRNLSIHIKGVNELAEVLVQNGTAVVKTTSRFDPQYEVRKKNLIRLRKAQRGVAALTSVPTPTVKQCRKQSR